MAVVESWATIFERPEELSETLTVNYYTNKDEIKSKITEEKTDLDNKSYVEAGNDFADLSVMLIGAPPNDGAHVLPDFDLDVHDFNHLLAGFIFGMTTENKLTEIEACYQGGAEMEKELATAIADFKAGGWNHITQGCL